MLLSSGLLVIFVQDLQSPVVSHFKKSGKPSPEGFGWIEARDDYLDDVELTHALKLTRTQYRQDYPYTGQVSSIEEYLDNGDGTKQLLNRQLNRYKQRISHSGKVHSVDLYTNRNDVYGFTSGDLIKF
jgi:hypothetical protein